MFDIKQRKVLKLIVFTSALLLMSAPFPFSGSARVVTSLDESSGQSKYDGRRFTIQSGATYNLLLQDDSSNNMLRWNSTTGDYLYSRCSDGLTLTGRGGVTTHGSTYRQLRGPARVGDAG